MWSKLDGFIWESLTYIFIVLDQYLNHELLNVVKLYLVIAIDAICTLFRPFSDKTFFIMMFLNCILKYMLC